MTIYELVQTIIFIILSIISGVCAFWAYEMTRRHDEAVEMWNKESESKNNQIIQLQEKIKQLESHSTK